MTPAIYFCCLVIYDWYQQHRFYHRCQRHRRLIVNGFQRCYLNHAASFDSHQWQRTASPARCEVTLVLRQATPARNQASPARNQATPAPCLATPALRQAAPALCQASPARSQTSPDRFQITPARCQVSPARCQASPALHQATPGLHQDIPARIQTSPECWEDPWSSWQRVSHTGVLSHTHILQLHFVWRQ